MSIQTFSPIATELLNKACNSLCMQDLFEPDLDEGTPKDVPLKSYVIMDIMSTISLDSERWVAIDYIDIERIANEIVVKYKLQNPEPRKSWL